MKLSKSAKARVKRLTAAKQKELLKATAMLADYEIITNERYLAVKRALRSHL